MSGPPQYPPSPGPPPESGGGLSQSEERTWALAAHIGALVAAFVAMAFLAPLIVLVLQGDKSPFVRRHAVESLNFQLSLLIYLGVGVLAALISFGILLIVIVPVALAAAVFALVVIIQATMAASRGEDYRYPLCIRLVK